VKDKLITEKIKGFFILFPKEPCLLDSGTVENSLKLILFKVILKNLKSPVS
jgi:hypothetical protein